MKILNVILSVAVVALGGYAWREHRRAVEAETRRPGSVQIAEPVAPAATQTEPVEEARKGASAATPIDPRPGAPPAPPVSDSGLTQLTRQLEERSEQLASARKAQEETEARLKDLEGRLQSLSADSQRLAGLEKELREQGDAAKSRIAALEEVVKSRDERMLKLEASNRELRQKSDDAGTRYTRLAKVSEDIEDLSRRREVYVVNILRRYRELTDLYRAVPQRSEAPRDDLSRIQNAVALAEEDLRQLQGLNVQAGRLNRDLAAAKK